jgi:hypothetical protein
MQTEKSSGSELAPAITCLRLLLALAFVLVAGTGLFAGLVLQKLNRVVVVAEHINAQVDRAVAATAPLGQAAIEKGVKTLEAVDTGDLGKSATEGVKEIGRSAKERMIEIIRQRAEEGKNLD